MVLNTEFPPGLAGQTDGTGRRLWHSSRWSHWAWLPQHSAGLFQSWASPNLSWRLAMPFRSARIPLTTALTRRLTGIDSPSQNGSETLGLRPALRQAALVCRRGRGRGGAAATRQRSVAQQAPSGTPSEFVLHSLSKRGARPAYETFPTRRSSPAGRSVTETLRLSPPTKRPAPFPEKSRRCRRRPQTPEKSPMHYS